MIRLLDPGGRMYGAVGTNLANIIANWTDVQAGGASLLTAANFTLPAGRTTGTCIAIANNNNQCMVKTIDNQATIGVALAFKVSSVGIPAIIGFYDVASTNNSQVDLRLTTSGQLTVTRNGTVLATSAFAITPNMWNHLEFLVTVHNTTGSYRLRINGVDELVATGVNTRGGTTNNYANIIRIGGISGGGSSAVHSFDDIIIYDGQANDAAGNPDIHDIIGDVGLACLFPSGAGTTTQFTPSAGSNFAAVDDTTLNDDTDYVESATVGNIDLYALADLPATVTAVKGFACFNYARKTDVGARGMKAQLRTGGTNFEITAESVLATTYKYYMTHWGSNPATVAAWAPAAINAIEIGQKVNS